MKYDIIFVNQTNFNNILISKICYEFRKLNKRIKRKTYFPILFILYTYLFFNIT